MTEHPFLLRLQERYVRYRSGFATKLGLHTFSCQRRVGVVADCNWWKWLDNCGDDDDPLRPTSFS